MIRTKYHSFTDGDLNTVKDTDWHEFVRKSEIEYIFHGIKENHFKIGLELGCGSGAQSKYLAYYCKKLVATEVNIDRLEKCDNDKISFKYGDAENLEEFETGQMDLIFSSNMLEHLRNVDDCLNDCKCVLSDRGIIVHTVPNRTWKIFNFFLYYPLIFKLIINKIINKSPISGNPNKISHDNNLSFNKRKHSQSKLLPEIHGVSTTHIEEYVQWSEKTWIRKFQDNGLHIKRIIRLPFYFGYGKQFSTILRFGNHIGLSSSTAYVLKKT